MSRPLVTKDSRLTRKGPRVETAKRAFPRNHGECRRCGGEVPGRALDDQMLGKVLCTDCLPPGFDSIATLKGTQG